MKQVITYNNTNEKLSPIIVGYDLLKTPLTFVSTNGTSTVKCVNSIVTSTEYSTNNITWNNFDNVTVTLNEGDKIYVRGLITEKQTTINYRHFQINGSVSVKGNIMSLYDYRNYKTNLTIDHDFAFLSLFENCLGIVDAKDLKLPAQTINSGWAYNSLMKGCSNLEHAFEFVYNGSEKTQVGNNSWGFNNIFQYCSKINYIKNLSTQTNNNLYSNWVDGVSPTGTFVKKRGVIWASGKSGIPSGWTVIEVDE